MSAEIFNFSAARRARDTRPRPSKNRAPRGQPRKYHKAHSGNNPLRAKLNAVSIAVTVVGQVIHRRWGFDPSTIEEGQRDVFLADLREGAQHARHIADEADNAIVQLGGKLSHSTAVEFFRALRIRLAQESADGRSLDSIFDQLESEAGYRAGRL